MGLAALLDVVLPPACAACGLPGGPACAACRGALEGLPAPLCEGCGGPVPVPVARCPACRGPIAGARQAVAWTGPAPALVLALKDGRRRTLAAVLAEVVAERVPAPREGSVLVPVPLAGGRERARGFNQSRLIAGALGRRWRLPVADCLRRVREGPPQRGASAGARVRQAAAAYAPGGPDPVPARAVLVDDVRTTGATLAGCARALRAGGAERVGAVCVARVV
jgi:ComF family protein